jgi:hypothetical protein
MMKMRKQATTASASSDDEKRLTKTKMHALEKLTMLQSMPRKGRVCIKTRNLSVSYTRKKNSVKSMGARKERICQMGMALVGASKEYQMECKSVYDCTNATSCTVQG